MRLRTVIALGIGVSTFFAGTTLASAATWAKPVAGPVQICFSPEGLPSAAAEQAAAAAATWAQVSSGLNTTSAPCAAGTNVVPLVAGSTPDASLALAKWNTQDGTTVSASIAFDVTKIDALIAQNGDSAGSWRWLMCHEQGHVLGLDHSTSVDSCLQTGLFSPVTTPGAQDTALIQQWYGSGGTVPAAQVPVTSAPTTVVPEPEVQTADVPESEVLEPEVAISDVPAIEVPQIGTPPTSGLTAEQAAMLAEIQQRIQQQSVASNDIVRRALEKSRVSTPGSTGSVTSNGTTGSTETVTTGTPGTVSTGSTSRVTSEQIQQMLDRMRANRTYGPPMTITPPDTGMTVSGSKYRVPTDTASRTAAQNQWLDQIRSNRTKSSSLPWFTNAR